MGLSQNHPSASDSAFPIFAIIVLTILATAFLLITCFTFVTRCCSNSTFTTWLSILRPPPIEEDPSLPFSPSIRNRGLHHSVIREIPTFQFVKGEADQEDKDIPGVYGCVVCLADFQEQEMLRVLPNCTHAFHLDCIDVWLQNNANCPLCRSTISSATPPPPPPIDHIIAPNSSPQFSQLLSNMASVEDFVVMEVGGEHEEAERNECTQKKARKCHHVSIMGDECIDVGDNYKDELICIQPIRRSFSMDSADVECNSRGRRSLFPFHYGRGSRNALLSLENEV